MSRNKYAVTVRDGLDETVVVVLLEEEVVVLSPICGPKSDLWDDVLVTLSKKVI